MILIEQSLHYVKTGICNIFFLQLNSPQLPYDYSDICSKITISRKIVLRVPQHIPMEINNIYVSITQQGKPQRK
jgi:hypothetical protein